MKAGGSTGTAGSYHSSDLNNRQGLAAGKAAALERRIRPGRGERVACGEVDRGVAICGSGVGACIAANKVTGVRAYLIHERFTAHQGVEDNGMNVICLGGHVVGNAVAWELVRTFLPARVGGAERHRSRFAKVASLESKEEIS
jgi:ribose 5-phosphate isomerase RpiB